MYHRLSVVFLMYVSFLCALIQLLPASAAQRYTAHLLPDPNVRGISPSGLVVGAPVVTQSQQAAILVPYGPVVLLGTLPQGSMSLANGANVAGQVVGYSTTTRLQTHAFVWSATTGMQDLGVLPGTTASAANAINSAGIAVGYGGGPTVSPLRFAGGTVTALPTLGGAEGFANAINDDGWIVGEAQTAAGVFHAIVWFPDGTFCDVQPPDLPGAGRARDINNAGVVVGWLWTDTGPRGFAWTQDGGLLLLEPLPGDIASIALGVGVTGDVIGASQPPDIPPGAPETDPQAVRWVDGVPEDLTAALVASPADLRVLRAVGISDDGVIAAVCKQGSAQVGCLLTPVEETPDRHTKRPQDPRPRQK